MLCRTAAALLAVASGLGVGNAFAPAGRVFVPPTSSTFASARSGSRTALSVTFGGAHEADDLFSSAVAGGWKPERGKFAGLRTKRSDGTIRSMYEEDSSPSLMPDGGLSPCVIKVVGVGGGGCNAVSFPFQHFASLYVHCEAVLQMPLVLYVHTTYIFISHIIHAYNT